MADTEDQHCKHEPARTGEGSAREVGSATDDAAARSREALDRSAEAGAEGIGQAGRTIRESAARTGDMAKRGMDELQGTGERVADMATRTADEAGQTGQRIAEQGGEVLLQGARAAAGVSGRIADAEYDSGRRLLGSAVRAFDVYREAGETSAHHVQALFESWLSLGRGVQQMQHAALALMDGAAGQARRQPQDLLRVNSLEELAAVQRDLYLDAVNFAFQSSTRLLELATRSAQEAIRPLRSADERTGGRRTA